jgi:hypothetical protein
MLAWCTGVEYIPHNAPLSGARILAHRSALASESRVSDSDILLTGSSRMMADCSATIVAEELARYWRVSDLTGRNLGNVGSDFGAVAGRLRRGNVPRLLILEFSPHMLGQSFDQVEPPTGLQARVAAHRERVMLAEMYASGEIRRILGLEGLVRIRPLDIPKIWRTLTQPDRENHRFVSLYYLLRAADGFAQRLQPDGQVFYYTYLPDRRGADQIRSVLGKRGGFNLELLGNGVNGEQIAGLKMVIDRVAETEGEMIVWRPPVDDRLYEEENRLMAGGIAAVRSVLAETGTPYIDMNPHSFSTSDLSHVDWFDTAELSRELAARVADALGADQR